MHSARLFELPTYSFLRTAKNTPLDVIGGYSGQTPVALSKLGYWLTDTKIHPSFLKVSKYTQNMYQIKQKPEDFVVIEKNNLKFADKGKYLVCRMKKENLTTQKAVQLIAEALNINQKDIGYAGTKDRHAITEQVISIKNCSKEKIERIKINKVQINLLGHSDEPVSLGDLEGNKFEITVRNLALDEKPKVIEKIPNYYDEQRFSRKNVEIGKYILKKDYKKAAELIQECDTEHSEKIKEHLQQNKNDFAGALKIIPKKTRMLYVHSVQSLIFNKTVSEIIKKENGKCNTINYSEGELVFPEEIKESMKIPLVGFDFEDSEMTPEIKKMIRKIMEKENIKPSDFIIKGFPEMTCETTEREMFAEVKNLKIHKMEDDELNSGKKKVKIEFELPKGSYATIVVKAMFG